MPIFAEVLKKHKVFDAQRVYGVTTLDILRASKFVSEVKKVDPKTVHVNVVGGHSGATIVPLLSQTEFKFTEEETLALTKRIQFGGDEVVKAKDGTGSATLSMAEAAARFAGSLLKALSGEKNIVESAYVSSPIAAKEGIEFFSTRVLLGKHGVEKIHSIGKMNAYETTLLAACHPELKGSVDKGVAFVKNYKK